MKYGVPISNVIYDDDGLRAFVKESVKNGNLKGAVAFNNNRVAYGSENYGNLKTQCYFKLAEYVNKGLIYVSDFSRKKEIIKELEQIWRNKNNYNNRKILLEKKSELKKRLGRSPDYADMMMMRMYTEVGSGNAQKIVW